LYLIFAVLPDPIRFAVFVLVVAIGFAVLVAYLTGRARMGLLR